MEAVTGSCQGSWPSVKSGIRLWAKYAVGFLGLQRPYPAPVWALVSWSKTFRSVFTFTGLHSFVCIIRSHAGVTRPTPIICPTHVSAVCYRSSPMHPSMPESFPGRRFAALHRSFIPFVCLLYSSLEVAIKKRQLWQPKPLRFIRLSLVARMMEASLPSHPGFLLTCLACLRSWPQELLLEPSLKVTMMWVLTAYVFSLRLDALSLLLQLRVSPCSCPFVAGYPVNAGP